MVAAQQVLTARPQQTLRQIQAVVVVELETEQHQTAEAA
jgi:hypothetical protein